MIQMVEDECKIEWKYPAYAHMTPEKKIKFWKKRRGELIESRMKEKWDDLYAKINGRSVNHVE